MVREAIQQGRDHLSVSKHLGSFAADKVGSNNDPGAFVEFDKEVAQQGAV